MGYFSLWVDVLSKFSLYTLAALPHILFGRRDRGAWGRLPLTPSRLLLLCCCARC